MKSPSTALVPGFFEQFRSHPDRPAFGFSDKVYTYGEVMDIVQGILHAMSNPSFAAERIVAVLATPDVHTYAAILAILASGRAYVPIHPQQPPERNWSCLEQAGTHVMLQSGAGSELQRWLGDGRHPIAVVDTTTALDRAEFHQPVATSAKDLAYLLFTSGSTGTPKGVPIYHRNLEAFFKALLHRDDIDFDGNDRFLAGLRALDRYPDSAVALHLWDRGGFDDLDPWRPFDRTEVLGRLRHLSRRHSLGDVNHEVRVRLPRLGAPSEAITKVIQLLEEVRHGQARHAGVLLTSLAVRIMAQGAGAYGPS